MSSQLLIFYSFAALITFCSLMVIASRNPVSSAIYLIIDLFLLAGLYAQMEAHFVAAIQVLVYAGAVVVLFMFVIMLLNQAPDSRTPRGFSAGEWLVLIMTLISFLAIAILIRIDQPIVTIGDQTVEAIEKAGGNTYAVGMHLFTKYLWPFELASILILLAIIACVVIAKKDKAPTGRRNKSGIG